MIYETLLLLKYMPKISIFYILFALVNGMGINYVILIITALLDLIDYIPTQ